MTVGDKEIDEEIMFLIRSRKIPIKIASGLGESKCEQGVGKGSLPKSGMTLFYLSLPFCRWMTVTADFNFRLSTNFVDKTLLFTQLATTLMMTGVIWLVQIVHYPLFQFVGDARYDEFHQAHMNRITYIVAPLMIAEAVTAALIIFYPPPNSDSLILWLGMILVAIVWASTFFLQVPLHEKLANGFDADTHRALVNTNWIRTIAWTFRSALILWLAWKA